MTLPQLAISGKWLRLVQSSAAAEETHREREIDTELATTKNNGYFLHNGMFTAHNLHVSFLRFAVFLLHISLDLLGHPWQLRVESRTPAMSKETADGLSTRLPPQHHIR